jgi:hypothetical protein
LVKNPNVLNLNQVDAQNLLKNEGLVPEISYVTTDQSKVNQVLSQYPTSDILLPKGSGVILYVGVTESININQPSNGTYVKQNLTVSGTAKNLQNGENVYVLVKPQPRDGDGPFEWYIQYTPIIVDSNGNWKCNAFFGTNGSSHRSFEIVAIISKENLQGNKYGYGFKLPPYTIKSDSVYVTRIN